MFIQENDNLQDEENSMFIRSEVKPSLLKAIYPEDIPIIEDDDEQNLHFSDGMFHIEDLQSSTKILPNRHSEKGDQSRYNLAYLYLL